MKIPIYQIDAFTDKQFKGNPAAICLLEAWLDDALMQKIAKENNLSETAFFIEKGEYFELRWFSPEKEIDLSGHATLATAYVIFEILKRNSSEVNFITRSGVLKVMKNENLLSMVFPSLESKKCEAPKALIKGLGKEPKEVYKGRDIIAVFETEEDIIGLVPDMKELKKIDTVGIIVTAKGNEVDFVSRYFEPKAEVTEDPVTGSAHCSLVPYWKKVLNKNNLEANQISKRGGKLYCVALEDDIMLSGQAVAYLEGFINV